MRLVLPTPSSPTRQILNLKVFCSGSTDGFRIMVRAVPSQGVIKPAARFSVSGTDWLEPFDVGDRADPIAPRPEFRGGLVHRLLVPPAKARIGLAVRAKLRARGDRVGAITDIEGFEPVRS